MCMCVHMHTHKICICEKPTPINTFLYPHNHSVRENIFVTSIYIIIIVVVIYKGRNMPKSIYTLKMARARIQT